MPAIAWPIKRENVSQRKATITPIEILGNNIIGFDGYFYNLYYLVHGRYFQTPDSVWNVELILLNKQFIDLEYNTEQEAKDIYDKIIELVKKNG